MNLIDALVDDQLHLVVFGAGFGECIVLAAPPTTYVVIDGCRIGSKSPAAAVLQAKSASYACAILTHPHLDHASGFDQVISYASGGVIACTNMKAKKARSWTKSGNPSAHVKNGAVEAAMAAIQDVWDNDPSRKWEPLAADSRTFGDVELKVLHPPKGVKVKDPNDLSMAIEVKWHAVRLVLGSDLLSKHWSGAQQIVAPASLGLHHAAKVPHHASSTGIHVSWTAGARDRHWVATPWNKGDRLPNWANTGGVVQILKHVDELNVTALPVRYSAQEDKPIHATRADLRDKKKPKLLEATVLGRKGAVAALDDGDAPLRNYVCASFDKKGFVTGKVFGKGSIVVTEAKGRKKQSTKKKPRR